MTLRAFSIAALLLATTSPVIADDEVPPAGPESASDAAADAALARARTHFSRGEYAQAKLLLVEAYQSSHRADLLFALGQAEFNLDHFALAIEYYEKFLATGPDPDRVTVAQQAIGAARARLVAPPPPPPPAPARIVQRHRWQPEYTGLLALGGVALALGGGLLVHGHRLGEDDGGSLTDYEGRLERSHNEQLTGLLCSIGGGVVIGAAVVAWRVRTVSETQPQAVVVTPSVSEHGAGLAIGGRW